MPAADIQVRLVKDLTGTFTSAVNTHRYRADELIKNSEEQMSDAVRVWSAAFRHGTRVFLSLNLRFLITPLYSIRRLCQSVQRRQ